MFHRHFSMRTLKRGNGYWKLDCSLLQDPACCSKIRDVVTIYKKDHKNDPSDSHVLRDALKCRFEARALRSPARRKRTKNKSQRQSCQLIIRKNYIKNVAVKQKEYDDEYQEITRGYLVRFKTMWEEHGGINSKYFFSLEKHRKGSSAISVLDSGR